MDHVRTSEKVETLACDSMLRSMVPCMPVVPNRRNLSFSLEEMSIIASQG